MTTEFKFDFSKMKPNPNGKSMGNVDCFIVSDGVTLVRLPGWVAIENGIPKFVASSYRVNGFANPFFYFYLFPDDDGKRKGEFQSIFRSKLKAYQDRVGPENPQRPVPDAEPVPPKVKLPPGWRSIYNTEGKKYYYVGPNGESQWDPPVTEETPPPPSEYGNIPPPRPGVAKAQTQPTRPSQYDNAFENFTPDPFNQEETPRPPRRRPAEDI